MKRTFKVVNLDCANCAAKMESSIARIEGVEGVSVSFVMQKLTLCTDDILFDNIIVKIDKLIKKIEPDCTVLWK